MSTVQCVPFLCSKITRALIRSTSLYIINKIILYQKYWEYRFNSVFFFFFLNEGSAVLRNERVSIYCLNLPPHPMHYFDSRLCPTPSLSISSLCLPSKCLNQAVSQGRVPASIHRNDKGLAHGSSEQHYSVFEN